MSPPPPLEFPGGRYLAAWWKQLAPLRPRAVWVAHLLLHRVEALVRTRRPVRLDDSTRLLLHALAPGATAADLAARLCLRPQVLGGLLRQLHAAGLAESGAGRWGLTPLGRQALEQGGYDRPGHERRQFRFVENESGRPPHFLHLLHPAGTPWNAGDDWTFDPARLRDCIARPPEWKERHGFPPEVAEVLDAAPTGLPPWHAVILDRPEHLPAALVLIPAEHGDRLLGYALTLESWTLNAREAVFTVPEDWPDVLPDLAATPPPESWRQAWLGWCQRRGLPTVEAEACTLERQDHRVRVRAPGRLLDRLRSLRSEALKGEAWLLTGSGRVRMAAQIELQT